MHLRLVIPLFTFVLAGCNCQPSPNGNEGQLQFNDTGADQPFGAESRVHIPEHIRLAAGGGKLDVRFPYDAQLDFKDTTLEAVTSGGLELVEVTQAENRDYFVTVLCKGSAPAPSTLKVKIKSGQSVRYEDSLDFRCHKQFETSSNRDGQAFIVGEQLDVLVTQKETPGGMTLTTHRLQLPSNGGFVFDYGDAGTPQNVYTGQPLKLRTVGFTNALVIQSGEMTASAPVRVLDDDQWKMRVTVTSLRVPDTGQGLIAHVKGEAVAEGDVVVTGTSGCTFKAAEIAGNTSASGDGCTGGSWMQDRPWKFCLKIRENEGCLVVELDGGSYPADAGL